MSQQVISCQLSGNTNAVNLTHESLLAGAARDFPRPFVDDYLRMVRACAEHDRAEIILRSTRMGFLTGAPCLTLS